MEILYLDLWFLLNLLCDYLLCLVTGRCAGLYLRRGRYLLAALTGALYACAALLPGCSALTLPGSKLLCGALMGWIAFGAERRPFRCLLLFFGVTSGFGGALMLLSRAGGGPLRLSFQSLLLSFALCYAAGLLLSRCGSLFGDKVTLRVTVELAGKQASFLALRDTGNRLRDPLSGARVLIASPAALGGLFGDRAALLAEGDPLSLLERGLAFPELRGRLRLLPYSSLGRGRALLPVFRPDRLLIEGSEYRDTLLAVSPQAAGEGFEAIF